MDQQRRRQRLSTHEPSSTALAVFDNFKVRITTLGYQAPTVWQRLVSCQDLEEVCHVCAVPHRVDILFR